MPEILTIPQLLFPDRPDPGTWPWTGWPDAEPVWLERAAPQLLQRFRDRGLCIEQCPTSNRDVVGFRDPTVPDSAACEVDHALFELALPGSVQNP